MKQLEGQATEKNYDMRGRKSNRKEKQNEGTSNGWGTQGKA